MSKATTRAGSSNQTLRPNTTLLTFLIADVRGYSRFTHDHGDEAAARLADRFAEIVDAVLSGYEGRVIELRGDEALAVFPSARSALKGAVALQQAFRATTQDDPRLPLRAGIGLDAGEAIPIRGGYRGGALNLAARLCSIAGAGEILASEAVIHLARKTEGLAFVDRGQVRLKGIPDPVRVLQIAPEGELPEALPPLQPILVTHPTNLPDEPTPFVGREDDIARIVAMLQQSGVRLVTLTGPGGTGKTRLALQVGNTLLYAFHDGVFFCDLAPLTDSNLVLVTIAEVLGVKEDSGTELMDSLTAHLRDKHLLLVLDNAEHVIDCAPCVASLLDDCRDLHILVTSRIPLHLSREQECPVFPLALPDIRQLPSLEELSRYDAVALFLQRAAAVNPAFTVTNETAPAIAQICAHLDGLPLAIELAAARIKLFPPQALLQRLDHRLRILTGGARDKPTRQQTLRGAIDWSYSLLTPEEQTLFARLAVFSGGFSFESAEVVANGDGRIDVFEGLASLVDKNLVRQEGEEEPRFTMLETIREYAEEKLLDREEDAAGRDAHAAYFVQLAEEAGSQLRGMKQQEWSRRLDVEFPNIRAAVGYLMACDRIEDVMLLSAALVDYWAPTVQRREFRRWLTEALACDHGQTGPRARGRALWAINTDTETPEEDRAAEPMIEEALALLRAAGDRQGLARALASYAGIAAWRQDRDLADIRWKEAMAMMQEIGDSRGVASALLSLSYNHMWRGEYDLAAQRQEQALPLARKAGDLAAVAEVSHALGHAAQGMDDTDLATRRYEEALAAYRQLGATYDVGLLLFDLATVGLDRGELESIAPRLIEARSLFEQLDAPRLAAATLGTHGLLAARQAQYDLAECYLRSALTELQVIGNKHYLIEVMGYMAELALRRGDVTRAARLLGAWDTLCEEKEGKLEFPPWRGDHVGAIRQVREALGDEAWERAHSAGAAMSLGEAVRDALEK